MIKLLRNRNVLLCGLFPNFVPEEINLEEYKKAKGLYIEDPWERVKYIFKTDSHGDFHPELKHAEQTFVLGMVSGAFYGGVKNLLEKSETFIRINESNIFGNKRQALSAFVNHNTLTLLNGAFKWAPIFGIFLGSFSLVSSCCEAYRNKPHVTDSTIAGTVVGGLSRFMFGIKGMISGAVVGGVLGSIYGVMVLGISKIAGTDQMELKYAQYAFANYRAQVNRHAKSIKREEDKIIENMGLHAPHVVNPLNQLDSEKDEPASSNNEKANK